MTDQPAGPDRVVARVNDITTTAMDALGITALAVGLGWTVATFIDVGAGIALGGLALMLLSAVAQRRMAGPKPKPPGEADQTQALPGPSDPGPYHFAGGR